MDQLQILQDGLRILRRRAILIALITVLGVLVSAMFAFTLPPRYETTARILVESQKIPDELARSTVTSSAIERLRLIEQRLMARDNIALLIDRLGLYADQPGMTQNDKIEALRRSAWIHNETFAPGSANSAVASSSITIGVGFDDPDKAAEIANELVTALMAQNLETRAGQTRQTLSFFDAERDRLADDIAELDRDITAFKTENDEVLPDSLEFRRDEIGRLLDARLEIDRRILTLEDQRGALQSGLAEDDMVARPLSPEASLLRELETDLAQRQLQLSPNHPEIQNLRGRIAAIRTVMGEEARIPGEAPQSARARSLERQVALLDSQIALLEDQRLDLDARKAEVEASLQRTPTIEAQLSKLERRRDSMLEEYNSIIRKRTEAATGERLEESQQAERFEVIEDALPPERPVSPNRRKILILGSAASLALSIGLVVLLEMFNPAIRSSAQFQRQLQITPLASIPYVRTRRERLRRATALGLAGLFLVTALPAALWAIERHIRPIQSLLDHAVERTGVEEMLRSVQTQF